jgi:uncharacterized protein YdhG (YjbR/CyaY superfamily)
MAATKTAQKSAKTTNKVFTAEERDAITQRAREVKASARRGATEADEASAVLASLAAMPAADRALGERLHKLITASAPALSPKTWYGMPAYFIGGKVVCHFQSAVKFKTRYASLGFSDSAKLDDGGMWPVAFALKKLTAADEARISALVKKAVG